MIHALAITGPTASGKTAISLEIAKLLGCEIISLDSMQIYKGMDIGTAKATKEEQREVPHHMIDILTPDIPFSAKAYKDAAEMKAKEISERGKTPLFVGGTGLYLSTLIRAEAEEVPESNPDYRKNIEKNLTGEEDRIALWKKLNSVDPESAAAVHYNNTRRVIRALEIFEATGKTKTHFDALSRRKNEKLSVTHITLDFHNRDTLYSRIDERVEIMVNLGLADEVKRLMEEGFLGDGSTASQAIGYKEIISAIKFGIPLCDAEEEIKKASRNYAKRQLTWFRHDETAIKVYADFDDGKMKPKDLLLAECLAIFEQ